MGFSSSSSKLFYLIAVFTEFSVNIIKFNFYFSNKKRQQNLSSTAKFVLTANG